jgi:hypothetical protein
LGENCKSVTRSLFFKYGNSSTLPSSSLLTYTFLFQREQMKLPQGDQIG